MSLPIITPAQGQPIHALKRELEDLGGVRHEDFKVVSGLARSAYQVTPELYQKWLEAGGVAAPAEDPEPGTPDPDAEATEQAGSSDAGDSSPSAEPATADPTPAGKDTAEEPAQADAETAPKTAPKATTTTKRSARSN